MIARSRGLLAAVALLAALAAGCTPLPDGVPPSTTPTNPPTFSEGRCLGTEGVTVVVDFAEFGGGVTVRCALGSPSTGIDALTAAGMAPDAGENPGTVCQLLGLPAQGHPYCWSTGGYWSYWRSPSAGPVWSFSDWGPASGPALTPGSVEGWRFAPFAAGAAQPPRVGTSGPVVP